MDTKRSRRPQGKFFSEVYSFITYISGPIGVLRKKKNILVSILAVMGIIYVCIIIFPFRQRVEKVEGDVEARTLLQVMSDEQDK